MKQILLFATTLFIGQAHAQCDPVTSISDDFESYPAGTGEDLPDCWTSKGDSGPVVGNRNTSGEANSGTKYISIYTFFTSNAEVYIISPELSTIDGNHLAEFYIKSSSTDATYQYGTMTDAQDVSTFVSTSAEINCTQNYTNVVTPEIAGGTNVKYFVIKVTGSGWHETIRIDDFEWRQVEVQGCDTPTQLSAQNITYNSAILSFSSTVGNYEIEYGEQGFILGQGNTITASNESTSIGSLNPLTTYDVYVKAICDTNNQSDFSQAYSFVTVADPVSSLSEIKNNISISPNPAQDHITIAGIENENITIFDNLGSVVKQINTSSENQKVNIESLKAGVYFIKVGDSTRRLIKN